MFRRAALSLLFVFFACEEKADKGPQGNPGAVEKREEVAKTPEGGPIKDEGEGEGDDASPNKPTDAALPETTQDGAALPDVPGRDVSLAATSNDPGVDVDASVTVTGLGGALLCSEPFLGLAIESYDELIENTWSGITSDVDTKGLCSTCSKDKRKECKAKTLDCKSFDEARNSIFAAYGHRFQDATWKAHFESKAWYRARAEEGPTTLPAVPALNVAILKWEALSCGAQIPFYEDEEDEDEENARYWDMDGDGKKESVSVGNGQVQIGKLRIPVSDGAWTWDWRVVDLNPADPAKQLLLRHYDDEDTYVYQVVSRVNGKLKLSRAIYGGRPFLTPTGLLGFRSIDCGQRSWEAFALRTGKLVQVEEKSIGRRDDDGCVACPFVYLESGSERFALGEILRNLRSPSLEKPQSLPLPSLQATRATRIVLAEEKQETTYLDAIWLQVGDQRVLPAQCEAAPLPAYCVADDRYFTLEQGQELELDFGSQSTSEAASLWAEGFYIPREAK